MRSTVLTAATLGLTLFLAGCGADSTTAGSAGVDEASTTTAADDAAATSGATDAAMTDEVCAAFFQNVPVSLAERAEKDRALLESGETLDPASFGEVNLLKQRIEDLGAEGDQGALVERINAPFVEASDAVLDDPEKSPTDAEITLPEIDVTDSAAAQEEFLASCSG
ncbi:hypothetical protein [Ornithinimicrobium tianjinense]|uniref:Uncharacterized protein n=1 Tax=Ornithinimicrobium tianjinense TaxID=1195761 RepID=A0A917BX27_9MICO|nr:hypothetical protein [Ornithinimicrobium tianjinense]GGF58963.1 hypothetical protein GCM10011366_28510 [Ornithinimicrobium tianjinense]